MHGFLQPLLHGCSKAEGGRCLGLVPDGVCLRFLLYAALLLFVVAPLCLELAMQGSNFPVKVTKGVFAGCADTKSVGLHGQAHGGK